MSSAEVSKRLKVLRRTFHHGIRKAERSLLARLLHRNRSQHRAARYFRRLQCCLRSRVLVDTLPLWPYVLTETCPVPSPPPTKAIPEMDPKLVGDLIEEYDRWWAHFSKVAFATRDDLQDMIRQGYYMSFCVTTWACIARIYTIEARLRTETYALASTLRASTSGVPAAVEEDVGGPEPTETDPQPTHAFTRPSITTESDRLVVDFDASTLLPRSTPPSSPKFSPSSPKALVPGSKEPLAPSGEDGERIGGNREQSERQKASKRRKRQKASEIDDIFDALDD